MSGCENLATKSDISAIIARLEAIERKIPDEERMTARIISAITGVLENVRTSILQALNDARLTIVTKMGALETVILANLRLIETAIKELGYSLRNSLDNLRDILISALNATKDGILGAINALRDVLIALIKALFGIRDEEQDNFNYERIEKAITGAHVQTRTIILQSLGNAIQQILEQLQGLRPDYSRIEALVAKHHAATKRFIAELFAAFKLPPIDFTEILNKLDQLASLVSATSGSILALLNTIFAFLKTFRSDANVDYPRIERAITGAHVATRSIILQSISSSVAYLAELIQGIRATVDYDRIRRIADAAANNIQNNINNSLKNAAIDYSRIASIIKAALGRSNGVLASLISAYGGAIYMGVQEVKELVKNRVTFSSGNSQSNAQINRIYQVLGCDDYPVTVPQSLITAEGQQNGTKQIPTFTQLFTWYIERFDELVGQWEIPIEIKDTDPTTPGDQPQKIKLPNLAEAIAEIMMLLLHTSINSETLVNITTRNLIGSEQDKLQNYKTYMSVESIADFLGFQRKDSFEKMPSLIDPTKEKLEEILQEKQIDVPVSNFDDKMTFKQHLVTLLEAAAITKAVHWQPINTDKDISAQIVKKIKDLKNQFDTVGGETDEQGNNKFDQFINDVEDGFRSYPNVSDPINPYGKPYEQRPKIRKIGNQIPNSD